MKSTVNPISAEPLVSIVIPTYNRAVLVQRTLNSVCTQTYPTLEILVIDDGSTDDTQAVIQNWPDPRVRYVYQPNQGVAAARNKGIDSAKGAIIGCCDSDDCYYPDAVSSVVREAQAHPECSFFYGNSVWAPKNERTRTTPYSEMPYMTGPSPCTLFIRSAVQTRFTLRCKGFEDAFFGWELAAAYIGSPFEKVVAYIPVRGGKDNLTAQFHHEEALVELQIQWIQKYQMRHTKILLMIYSLNSNLDYAAFFLSQLRLFGPSDIEPVWIFQEADFNSPKRFFLQKSGIRTILAQEVKETAKHSHAAQVWVTNELCVFTQSFKAPERLETGRRYYPELIKLAHPEHADQAHSNFVPQLLMLKSYCSQPGDTLPNDLVYMQARESFLKDPAPQRVNLDSHLLMVSSEIKVWA